MKIVQVETFYEATLRDFYVRRPELPAMPAQDQIEALLRDGFSAGHNIAPYLTSLGYEPTFIIANCSQTQIAWLRDHGLPFPEGGSVQEILRRQIDMIQPDILYFSDAINFDSGFVNSLSHRPRLVLGWHAAPLPDNHDWSAFDVILSGLSSMRIMARLLGAKAAEHFMPGIPPWTAPLTSDVEEETDLVFAGSFTPFQHGNRNRLLVLLAEQAARKGYSGAFHLTAPPESAPALAPFYRPPVFGNRMLRALKAGRIVFDARSTMVGRAPDGNLYDLAGSETSNMRIFEATGAGAFLLTEHFDNLADYFEIGREIETFRSDDELLEKVEFYLAHPEIRRSIAWRGQQRCLTDYSMQRRAEEFDAILRRYL